MRLCSIFSLLSIISNVTSNYIITITQQQTQPQIFKEFQGTHYDLDEYMKQDWSSAGDVKYHLGR